MSLYDRMADVQSAIRNSNEIDFSELDAPEEEPVRHSLDTRFDRTPRTSIDSVRVQPKTSIVARASSLRSLASRSKRPSPLPRIDSERLTQTNGNNATINTTWVSEKTAQQPLSVDIHEPDTLTTTTTTTTTTTATTTNTNTTTTTTPPPIEELEPLEERFEKLNLSTLRDEDSIGAQLGLSHIDSLSNYTDYKIYNAFVTNLRVCPVDLDGRYFYLEHRSFLPNVPGVVLHAGIDKEGPILGSAHLPLFHSGNRIGIGDHKNDPTAVRWESLDRTTFWTHMRYVFSWELPSGDRRRFLWIRTRNNVIDDQGDYVLIEEGKEGMVLAEYTARGLLKWKKRGRLRLRNLEGLGEHWEEMVLLTWASVLEMSRRRSRQRRISGAHLLL